MCPWGVVTYASRQLITMGFSAWRAIAFRFEIGDEIRIDSSGGNNFHSVYFIPPLFYRLAQALLINAY